MRGRSVLAAVAVVVSLLAVPAAAGAAPSSWPQFGFGAAHTFVNPHETTLSASTVPGLTQAWIASPGPNRPTDPVVADGNVYTVEYTNFDPSKLVAKKAATGATAWSFIPRCR